MVCGASEQDSKSADADLFLIFGAACIFECMTCHVVRTHAPYGNRNIKHICMHKKNRGQVMLMLHLRPLNNPLYGCLIESQYFSNHMLRIALLVSFYYGFVSLLYIGFVCQ